jgi:hypothetical protein
VIHERQTTVSITFLLLFLKKKNQNLYDVKFIYFFIKKNKRE